MYIKEIELKNFRNYENLKINFNQNLNFIIGKNAQGKTNLLESIFICSMGKSFRTSKDSEMIKFGKDFSRVTLCAQKQFFETVIDITLKSEGKKFVKVDGINILKTSQLLENVYIVVFSPEDLKIVKDEPEKRRKFIDRELSVLRPAYFDSLSKYKKVIIQRNNYLKEKIIDPAVLDIWDTQLSHYGADIMKMRKEFTEKLNIISSRIHSGITDGKEKSRLEYEPNVKITVDIQKNLYDAIKKSYDNDIRLRTTTRGPHRDDITFYIDEINVRNFGSQGQQRTAALSLKLAELDLIKEETGEEAVLLLDDVMSELDNNRQKFLIETLSANQIFITSTEISENLREAASKGKIITVEDGNIKS